MFRIFFEAAPVTKYTPAVFDAFVNQTKVSPSGAYDTLTLRPECEYILSSGGLNTQT
jgi:hypothetical protein